VAESGMALGGRPISGVAGVALREHFVRPREGGRWPNPQRVSGVAPFSGVAGVALREHFVRPGEDGGKPNPQRLSGAARSLEWQAWHFANIS
jgi:hypothetical protein